jgi:hypothetical protein
MAYLAATITNLAISIHGKKGSKLKELKDFMPVWDKAGQPIKMQTVEEMKEALLHIAQSFKKKPGNQPKQRPPKKIAGNG